MAAFTARFHSRISIVILTFLVLVLVPYYNCQGKEIVRKSESPLNTSPKFKPVALPLMVDPIVSKTTPEIIRYYGYRDESHQVTSEDGYISTWHRVLPATSPDKFKGPVIIQHGIFGSSSEWFVNTKENLLPFKLADAGYDIWLGNSRGGNYARGHVNMTTSNPKFWDFSVNEMGKYGIPAAIDYILAKTGHSKLHYIGYSMGAATLCVTMSHRPEYNEKVKLLVGLAPAVYLSNLTSGFVRLFTLAQLLPPVNVVQPIRRVSQ